MQTLRVRVKASDFKEVERKGNITIVRWDASPEIVTIPSKRKGEEQAEKETGWLVCSERIYRNNPTSEQLQADIKADLALRHPEGGAPVVNIIHRPLTD